MPKLRPNQFLLPSGALITEIPLLFQPEMVQANLEDRKNQTRRTRGFTNQNPDQWELCWVGDTLNDQHSPNITGLMCFGAMFQHTIYPKKLTFNKSPYGKPGDLLWVKETWQTTFENEQWKPIYRADGGFWIEDDGPMPWKPSIHMRKKYSRIWAMVEEIRVERLIDISPDDAIAEGIETYYNRTQVVGYKNYLTDRPKYFSSPLLSFFSLIDKVNKCQMAAINPFVWVVKYRILSKTGRPSMELIQDAYQQVVSPPVVC